MSDFAELIEKNVPAGAIGHMAIARPFAADLRTVLAALSQPETPRKKEPDHKGENPMPVMDLTEEEAEVIQQKRKLEKERDLFNSGVEAAIAVIQATDPGSRAGAAQYKEVLLSTLEKVKQ